MVIKYTKHFLNRLEDIFAETEYVLRYEKGNFKSGYCIIKEKKVVIVNKYYSMEGKINCLVDILKSITPGMDKMTEKNKKLFLELTQTTLNI